MNTETHLSSFLLIDGSQLTNAELPVPTPDERHSWMTHIYDDKAATVSPLVIDIEAALAAEAGDQLTHLVNEIWPQLHASLIDTTLSHAELTHHLRRFIIIRTMEKKAYTLRFADCTVLPILSTVLTPAQWSALLGPITRWCVHGLDGSLLTLPPADNALSPSATPLMLSDEQIAALADATAPSMVLANLRGINHGDALLGSLADQHRWASEARTLWRAAGNTDDIVLRWLTSAALDTEGKILLKRHLPKLLAGRDTDQIRARLISEVSDHDARMQRALE